MQNEITWKMILEKVSFFLHFCSKKKLPAYINSIPKKKEINNGRSFKLFSWKHKGKYKRKCTETSLIKLKKLDSD